MNTMKKLLISMISIFTLTVFFSFTACAIDADYIRPLKEGQTVTGSPEEVFHEYSEEEKEWYGDDGYWETVDYADNIYYKITIPANGYLTITSDDNWLDIYDSKRTTYRSYWTGSEKNGDFFSISKGTYYIRDLGADYTMKYKFTPAVKNTANYCKAKAVKLAAGKMIAVQQTKKYNYSRWYKIILPKKKNITFWTNDQYQVYLYNSAGKRLKVAHDSDNKYYSYSKQKKGTYYARILSFSSSPDKNGNIITFKWK